MKNTYLISIEFGVPNPKTNLEIGYRVSGHENINL